MAIILVHKVRGGIFIDCYQNIILSDDNSCLMNQFDDWNKCISEYSVFFDNIDKDICWVFMWFSGV